MTRFGVLFALIAIGLPGMVHATPHRTALRATLHRTGLHRTGLHRTAVHRAATLHTASDNETAHRPHVLPATIYADWLEGQAMTNGQPFSHDGLTVAMRSCRLNSMLRLSNAGHTMLARCTDHSRANGVDMTRRVYESLGAPRRVQVEEIAQVKR